VRFVLQTGGGQLALTNSGSPAFSGTLYLHTDAGGLAQVYYRQAPTAETPAASRSSPAPPMSPSTPRAEPAPPMPTTTDCPMRGSCNTSGASGSIPRATPMATGLQPAGIPKRNESRPSRHQRRRGRHRRGRPARCVGAALLRHAELRAGDFAFNQSLGDAYAQNVSPLENRGGPGRVARMVSR